QIGTLSKAIGVLGGYVAGPQVLIDYLVQRARPFLFSTSHPPAVTAACLAALDILEQDDSLIKRLWDNARYLDRKSTRLNSSHVKISYAVFCSKKIKFMVYCTDDPIQC